jgi:hypothetical protein
MSVIRFPGLARYLCFGYQVRSLILTSQSPVPRWHEQIGDPTVADGILDRLADRIEMKETRCSRTAACSRTHSRPGGVESAGWVLRSAC